MGASFTNVQVHTGSLGPEQARAPVIAALRAWAAGQGLHELSDDDRLLERDVHRTIVVGPITDGLWIAVFDENTEDQRHEDLIDLTRRMSRIAGAAVGVLDQHSDMLGLWLAQDGELVDEFRSQQVPGDADRWRDVLINGATSQQLRKVLDTNVAFAEDLLPDLAPLFGWDGLCTTGYHYLEPGLERHDPASFTILDLRYASDPLADRRGSGLPVLVPSTSFPLVRVAVGEEIGAFIVMFQSTGGASEGLGVVIWGPGLDLLDLEGVRLASKPGEDPQEFELLHSVATEDSTPLRYVEIPDFPIPRGISDTTYDPALGLSYRRTLEAQYAACISVSLVGRGAQTGTGPLYIGVTPSANRGDGQTSFTAQVSVS